MTKNSQSPKTSGEKLNPKDMDGVAGGNPGDRRSPIDPRKD